MDFTQEITLDLNANGAYTTIVAKQGDSARWLKIHLTKDNIPYPLDVTHNFMFRMRKPDGFTAFNPSFVELGFTATYIPIEVTFENLYAYVYYQKDENDEYNVLTYDDFFTDVTLEPPSGETLYIKQDNGKYRVKEESDHPDNVYIFNVLQNTYYAENSINQENSTVNVQLTEQILAVAGRGYADIVEYNESDVLSSISFIVNVMASPGGAGKAISTDDFSFLSEKVAAYDSIMNEAIQKSPYIGEGGYWYALPSGATAQDSHINTNIKAEGEKGDRGTSYYIVDTVQVEPSMPPAIVTTDYGALIGTVYYNDASASSSAGQLSKVTKVIKNDNNYVITLDGSNYYIKSEDVKQTGDLYAFYVLSIPKGDVGEPGKTGAAGLGGVSWVDGIIPETELHLKDKKTNEPICTLYSASLSSDYKTLSWQNSSNLSIDYVKTYYAAYCSSSYASISSSEEFIIIPDENSWVLNQDSSGSITSGSITFGSAFSDFPSEDTIYLFGQEGERSGNVKIYGVSYIPQSEFITYGSDGLPSRTEITDGMRAQARANIKAMEEFEPTPTGIVYGINDFNFVESGVNYYNSSDYTTDPVGVTSEVTHVTVDGDICTFISADTTYYVNPINVNEHSIWSTASLIAITSTEIEQIIGRVWPSTSTDSSSDSSLNEGEGE